MKRLLSTAAAALVLTAGAASAQGHSETKSVSVAYLDLNLSSPTGRATLERRVSQAIDRICGERPAPYETTYTKIRATCLDEARKSSRAQLAELFANRTLAENVVRIPAR
jgi:UrcA family protein